MFAGSLLFTVGGALQSSLAYPHRRVSGFGRAAWWAAAVQSAGTLFFNVTTYQAMHTALTSAEYDRLVWRPDALGSVCFLISGAIAYRAAPRHGWRPARGGAGWWEPAVNLLGCIFFGISAVARAGRGAEARYRRLAQTPRQRSSVAGWPSVRSDRPTARRAPSSEEPTRKR